MTYLPRWLTPHRAVLLGLALLAGCAFVVSVVDDEFVARPGHLAASLVTALVVCAAVTALGGAVVRVPPGADSWAITALILFFILPSGTDTASLTTIAVGAAVASASKYVLAWRRRLIVNPAVAGAVACYGLAYAGVGVLRYPSWWIASDSLLWPMIIIAAIVVTAIGRWHLVAAFLAASVLTILATSDGDPQLSLWLVSSPMLFVAAIMLPEPLTCPGRLLSRTVYAAGIGFLMYCGLGVEVSSAYTLEFVPEIALLIGCLFSFAVALATGTAARTRIDLAPTTPIADRSWLIRARPGTCTPFAAGQWASLSAPSWSVPLFGRTRRVFSFVNAPGSGIEFAVTSGPEHSDFKQKLIDGRTTRLYLDGTGGDFVLPARDCDAPLVFLSAGIGLTPIVSMLRTLTSERCADAAVLQVIRRPDRSVFGDDLAAARAAGVHVEVVESAGLADGLDPETLAGLLERAGHSDDDRRPHYFISGNPLFVRRTSAAVRAVDPATRINTRRLHRDAFAGY